MRKEMAIDIKLILQQEFDARKSALDKRRFLQDVRKETDALYEKLFALMAETVSGQELLTGDKPTKVPAKKPASNKPILEGFWYSKEEPNFPDPKEFSSGKTFKGKTVFLTALREVEATAARDAYKGSSTCRICGCRNGSKTFKGDGFNWPEGYAHYIEKHNVKPTAAFIAMILKKADIPLRKGTVIEAREGESNLSKALTTIMKPGFGESDPTVKRNKVKRSIGKSHLKRSKSK